MRIRRLAVFVVASMVAAIPACAFAGEVNVSVDVGDHGSVNEHNEDYSEKVDEDSTYDLKIQAEDGYEIHTVLVNDEPVEDLIADPVTGEKEAEITLGDVGSDVDISAVFRAASETSTVDGGEDNDSDGDSDADETDPDGDSNDSDSDGDKTGDADGGDSDANKTDGDADSNPDGDKTGDADGGDSDASKTDGDADSENSGNSDSNKTGDNNGESEDKTGAVLNVEPKANDATGSSESVDTDADTDTDSDTDTETLGSSDDDREDAGSYGDSHYTGSPKTGDTTIPIPIIVTILLWSVLMAVSMSIIRRRS